MALADLFDLHFGKRWATAPCFITMQSVSPPLVQTNAYYFLHAANDEQFTVLLCFAFYRAD